jgi:hypothetical protein
MSRFLRIGSFDDNWWETNLASLSAQIDHSEIDLTGQIFSLASYVFG